MALLSNATKKFERLVKTLQIFSVKSLLRYLRCVTAKNYLFHSISRLFWFLFPIYTDSQDCKIVKIIILALQLKFRPLVHNAKKYKMSQIFIWIIKSKEQHVTFITNLKKTRHSFIICYLWNDFLNSTLKVRCGS